MRVLLLSRYGRLGASSRLRSYQYLSYLESRGVEVTVAPFLGDDYVAALYDGEVSVIRVLKSYFYRLVVMSRSNQFDLIWVEKEMFPWIPSWIERGILSRKSPLVLDYDDARFHCYDQHRNPLMRFLLRNKIDVLMKRAELVIVGNDYLGNRAQLAGAKKVEWLPTVVDLSRYSVLPTSPKKQLTIGWIGTPNTARYLLAIRSALVKLKQSHNVKVVAIGANTEQLSGLPIDARAWSEDTEVEEIQRFDIGIMPLPDEPFERGKCGYKLIQYMACGKPVVASSVGVNSDIVHVGINGFLANSPDEWYKALKCLCEDSNLREKMGKAGRCDVEARYSLQVAAPRMAELLYSVVKTQVNDKLFES